MPGPVHLVIHQRQHVAGGVEQHGTRPSKPNAFSPAMQELRADDLLQPPDLLAQRRLSDEYSLRGLGKAARIGERDEVAQMPQLDAVGRVHVNPINPRRSPRWSSSGPRVCRPWVNRAAVRAWAVSAATSARNRTASARIASAAGMVSSLRTRLAGRTPSAGNEAMRRASRDTNAA